nr:PREDICTED: probable 28S ribosomal protein S23, mitochondrial [Bemisia tabaci]
MASNRFEKIGTIYSRITGLLRAGATKWENKPLWYNVYRAFPPLNETSFGSPVPDTPIRNIFYAEDKLRAKFHKDYRMLSAVRLDDRSTPSECQTFIQEYKTLVEEKGKAEKDAYSEAFSPFQKKLKAEMKKQHPPETEEVGFDSEESPRSEAAPQETLSEKDAKELYTDIFKK